MPRWKQQTVKYGRGIWKDRRKRSPPRDAASIVRAGFAKFWVHDVLLEWISRPYRGQVIRQRCSRWCFTCPEKIEEQSLDRESSRQNLEEKRPRLPLRKNSNNPRCSRHLPRDIWIHLPDKMSGDDAYYPRDSLSRYHLYRWPPLIHSETKRPAG